MLDSPGILVLTEAKMRDVGKAREQALDLAIAGLKRRDDRIDSAIRIIDETVSPEHRENATYRAVETFYFRRHAVARGADRNVSGQDYQATGKRLRPADSIRSRGPGKRTGLGADRSLASNSKQAGHVANVQELRKLVADYHATNARGRKYLRPQLLKAAGDRGMTLARLLDSFR